MCGIAGIVNREVPCDRDVLVAMTNALAHRGPDAEGFYVNGRVGLGHRRLSIIDLSPAGRNPMSNEDGTVWIVFNGEVYNFQSLRPALEAKGHVFRSNTDTEVVLHLFEEEGAACLQRLRGMFAFAIWSERNETLFLARDRVGKKPLLYSEFGGNLAFASEFQGLLRHPQVDRAINRGAIDAYLTYGYVPPPATGFAAIRKLPPAHYLTWRHGHLQSHCYWQLDYEPKLAISEEEAGERVLAELREAVRLRMISDVPLGAFLSGGIDSSAIVALMSEMSSKPVKTFSIGFDEAEFNELDYARAVAQRFGADHYEEIVRPRALDILPQLARHYGEPYADSSAVPSYYVAQATRRHVTVALNGDGGDESFAGYDRYLGTALAERYQRLPRALRRGVLEPASSLIPEVGGRRGRLQQTKRFLQAASAPLVERYLRWMTYVRPELKNELYTEDFRRELQSSSSHEWLPQLMASTNGLAPLDKVLHADVNSYLPSDLLVKMDIATMANSLEARSPFLDQRVMELAARLPVEMKIKGRTLKYLLKRTLRDLVPARNLHRRKQGFGVPVGEWFRGELKDLLVDTVLSSRAITRGFFREPALRGLVNRHWERHEENSYQLWSLLMLELWFREVVD